MCRPCTVSTSCHLLASFSPRPHDGHCGELRWIVCSCSADTPLCLRCSIPTMWCQTSSLGACVRPWGRLGLTYPTFGSVWPVWTQARGQPHSQQPHDRCVGRSPITLWHYLAAKTDPPLMCTHPLPTYIGYRYSKHIRYQQKWTWTPARLISSRRTYKTIVKYSLLYIFSEVKHNYNKR